MPSWWGKSFSKDVKKKKSKETPIGTPNILVTEQRGFIKSVWSKRRCRDVLSEKGSWSRAVSRSPSPTSNVSRCQSFADRPHSQPLPVPELQTSATARTPSRAKTSMPMLEKRGKPPLQLPFLIRDGASTRQYTVDIDRDMVASVSSNCSVDSDDPADSRLHSPRGNDFEDVNGVAVKTIRFPRRDRESPVIRNNSREQMKCPIPASQHNAQHTSPKCGIISTHKPSVPMPRYGGFVSAPDSSMSSPCRSPRRAVCPEQIPNSILSPSKMYTNAITLNSGQCSSPGSGQTSGHNSIGGDFSGQMFWQHNRGSAEVSPIPSPRITSPGPSSRVHSGAVTPLHPRAGGTAPGSPSCRNDEGKKQSHRLPLPPPSIANPSPLSPSTSSSNTPSTIPRSPGKHDNSISPGSHWKKGKMIGRGTFGHVYVGFNSESGEMCAMKEVTLFSDDVKSKESARQLAQEISLLSRLRHQNIVQYYGSDMIDDKLYIYLEYVSGGSIYKLLQEYGRFGEIAIRSYTHQILSGLAYLHAKNHVHRDIKGANILVDPNGRVKLADFGMAKHITGQSCPLSFKGSPYWMAPEVIKNSNGCNLAVDIWSLGCTVLEMATSKPPWSQYEGIAAMFKIGNSKELPPIPDHLSEEGKDFVRQCLRREPSNRPTASELLQHPFVNNALPLERSAHVSEHRRPPEGSVGVKGIGHVRNLSSLDIPRIRQAKPCLMSSDNFRNASCPISPVGSPHLRSSGPYKISGKMSPSPISSPMAISGSSTPLTGGNGAIPLNREPIQLAYLNDGSGNAFRSNNMYMNISTYQDGRHDNLFRVAQLGSTVLPAFPSDIAGLPSIKSKHGDIQKPYDGFQKVKPISLPY